MKNNTINIKNAVLDNISTDYSGGLFFAETANNISLTNISLSNFLIGINGGIIYLQIKNILTFINYYPLCNKI